MFGSVKNPEEADDKGMGWGRFEKYGDRIIIWIPNYKRFSDLVNDGLLPGHPYAGGRSDGNSYCILSGLKPEHMNLITSGSKEMLFEWQYPSFMVRVSDDID